MRDVLTTLRRRMPGVPVVLYPTAVQGEGAAQKIAQAIRTANERAECDTLILCRGGGSIEDLWAFNEEVVARAVAASTIPLVCGVGHETDFTIADFVADQRAATPTAAAQLAVPEREELKQQLLRLMQRLQHGGLRRFATGLSTAASGASGSASAATGRATGPPATAHAECHGSCNAAATVARTDFAAASWCCVPGIGAS